MVWLNLCFAHINTSSTNTNPTPLPSDETANWKTYTNNKYGYSVKYPPNWETYAYGLTPKDDSSNILGEQFFRPAGLKNGSSITISPSFAKETSSTVGENSIKNYFDNRKVNSIDLDGAKGIKVEGETKEEKQAIAIFTNGKLVIEIQAVSSEGVSIFDQILSTFRFD